MKPCINITTKDSSYKQIIIFIENDNINKFIKTLSKHIANLSCSLKGIKSDTIVDFICSDY